MDKKLLERRATDYVRYQTDEAFEKFANEILSYSVLTDEEFDFIAKELQLVARFAKSHPLHYDHPMFFENNLWKRICANKGISEAILRLMQKG